MTIIFIIFIIIGLISLSIFGVYTAIKNSNSSRNEVQFQSTEWFLAVYSTKSEGAKVDKNSPKLVIRNYDSNVNFLLADNAPITY